MKKRHQQKLLVLSVVLLVTLNLPLVLLFDSATNVLGFPLLYIYIFSVWILSVLISMLIVNKYYE